MGLMKLLGSKRVRQLSVLSTLFEAVTAFRRGKTKLAALLVGVAALSYKRSGLGFVAQLAIKLLKKRR